MTGLLTWRVVTTAHQPGPHSVGPLQLLMHDKPAEGLRQEKVDEGEGPEGGQAQVHLERGPAEVAQGAAHQATQGLTCTNQCREGLYMEHGRHVELLYSA